MAKFRSTSLKPKDENEEQVLKYLHLVDVAIAQIPKCTVPREDLQQIGRMGLMKAVAEFKVRGEGLKSEGVAEAMFVSYALQKIKWRIYKYGYRSNRLIYVPYTLNRAEVLDSEVSIAVDALGGLENTTPEMLAEYLGISKLKARNKLHKLSVSTISSDTPLSDSGMVLDDLLSEDAEEETHGQDEIDILMAEMDKLTPAVRKGLMVTFGFDGAEKGKASRQSINQASMSGLRILRKRLTKLKK